MRLTVIVTIIAALGSSCAAPPADPQAKESSESAAPAPEAAAEKEPAAPQTAKRMDWPQWGGNGSNNMVSSVTGLPKKFNAGKKKRGTDEIDLSAASGVKYVYKIGSQSYGTPTIAGGKILIGTNNESPRDSKHEGDRGVVMCVDEETGEFLWQLVVPKLGAGKVSDWEFLGICSSPLIDGDRAYAITNRCEVICIDMNGFADGNQGMQDEGQYMAGPGKPPVEPGKTDADVIWVYDMREELGVFPHNIASSSPALVDGKLIVTTSNGVDWTHINKPAPQAPALVALDPKTGALIGEEGAGVSESVMHCNWSSPATATVKGKPAILFAGGDGFVHAFGTVPVKDEDDFDILPQLWKVDGNLKEFRFDEDGKPIKYATFEGPSEHIASPVVVDGAVYSAIGQDPEHGEGVGLLTCTDLETGEVRWQYKELERSISTPSVKDGLVYIADYRGRLHCVDAKDGKQQWVYDTKSHIWGSTLVADGRVFLGNEDGELVILKEGRTMEELDVVEFTAPIYSSPVAANGTLYITTQTHIYAFAADAAKSE